MAADSSAEIPANLEWRPPYHYSTPCGIEAGLRGPLCQHLRLISSSHTIRAGAWLDLFRVNFPAVTAERLFHFFFILGLIRPAIVPARSELGIGTRSTDALDRNVAQPLCYSQEWHFNAHVSQRARSFRRLPQSFGDKKRSSGLSRGSRYQSSHVVAATGTKLWSRESCMSGLHGIASQFSQ
jgi:hypothetical protein